MASSSRSLPATTCVPELDDTVATWTSIILPRPSATICLLSGLWMHELTEVISRETDLALPRGEAVARGYQLTSRSY